MAILQLIYQSPAKVTLGLWKKLLGKQKALNLNISSYQFFITDPISWSILDNEFVSNVFSGILKKISKDTIITFDFWQDLKEVKRNLQAMRTLTPFDETKYRISVSLNRNNDNLIQNILRACAFTDFYARVIALDDSSDNSLVKIKSPYDYEAYLNNYIALVHFSLYDETMNLSSIKLSSRMVIQVTEEIRNEFNLK